MKIAGLFGVPSLIAVPVIAVEPPAGACAGKVPTSTVEKCDNQPCTFTYEYGSTRNGLFHIGNSKRFFHQRVFVTQN